MKRVFDILVSVSALLVLSPVFIAIPLMIRRDGGPALFRQPRVGLHGKVFSIYKFRSMVMNSEQLGGHSTQADDPRITRVGKFIRKTSIDELPQLLNVIRGEMSIVGPRPNVPAQRTEYTQQQWDLRNSVLPGITGLAQATLRSNATWQQRYDLDAEYVRACSMGLDLKIILLTVKQIFTKGGN
ncbi:sugar transferase [Marinobacter confluentis]|uniref:Sugar transferase n=1 Tax=Marinobacter confluentis TaxID=1697557 RepID=A0A4Z1CH80_9GAMM|nr:sugar transferase [Marinobacter confluentis]TGN39922.1 sugar transferase [Marinobacter confluentis]